MPRSWIRLLSQNRTDSVLSAVLIGRILFAYIIWKPFQSKDSTQITCQNLFDSQVFTLWAPLWEAKHNLPEYLWQHSVSFPLRNTICTSVKYFSRTSDIFAVVFPLSTLLLIQNKIDGVINIAVIIDFRMKCRCLLFFTSVLLCDYAFQQTPYKSIFFEKFQYQTYGFKLLLLGKPFNQTLSKYLTKNS